MQTKITNIEHEQPAVVMAATTLADLVSRVALEAGSRGEWLERARASKEREDTVRQLVTAIVHDTRHGDRDRVASLLGRMGVHPARLDEVWPVPAEAPVPYRPTKKVKK